MIPFMIFFGWLSFTYVDGWSEGIGDLHLSFLFFPALLILFVLHEVIHGLVWGLFAGLRSIRFGVIWKMLTPYCTCSSVLGKWQYVLGAAMPTILLGFLMSFIAIYMDNILLSVLSLFMILGGGGDLLIILKLLSHPTRGKEVLYIDHPYECGLVAFER